MRPILYFADVTPLSSPELFAAATAAVGRERRELALRSRRAGERELSLAAGLLLSAGLAEAGLTPPEEFPKNEYGKPYIPGNGIHFSLSHSGKFAVCAISPVPVGCDVQEIRKGKVRIAERYFSPAEAEALAAVPEEEKQAFFCRVWALKESFSKAAGLGMRLPFPSFTALPGSGRVTGRAEARTYEWEIPGYALALCTLEKTPAPELRRADLTALINKEGMR